MLYSNLRSPTSRLCPPLTAFEGDQKLDGDDKLQIQFAAHHNK